MVITGHRGACGLEQENTIRSFKKAQSLGVDEIEMDLRATKDKCIVVHHDPDLRRTHQDARRLAEVTWEELQRLNQQANYPTPQFSEVLSQIQIPLNLEVKESGFEQELLHAIKEFPSEVLISSFQLRVLKKIRALDRKIKLALIISPKKNHFYLFILRFLGSLKLYSINLQYSLVTPQRVALIHELGMKTFTWVINDMLQFEAMQKNRVDGIHTDYPDKIKR